jgi:two-component system, OmpR family, KDP operon response regulator KdpE
LPNAKVVVIDDEQSVRRFLDFALTAQGYRVSEAATGREGVALVATEKPDVVVLDLGLPDIDGTEVIRLLREWTLTPIVVLSVRGSERDKIDALDAGADDYLTKPFGAGELMARLRAALRRSPAAIPRSQFSSGDLSVDLNKRLVTRSGHEIQLTPTEYSLLGVLIARAGMVTTHRQLLHGVWGPAYMDEAHMLHVNISNLRRKIETDPTRPEFIITEPGVGYRFREE